MKQKHKTWKELKDDKCPKCKSLMMTDMFTGEALGCSCGFVITAKTKNLLVKRDKDENNIAS